MSDLRHQILPRDAEPCIWMSAGLVSYKLCDRDFDCGNCPLDAALRGNAAAPVGMSWLFLRQLRNAYTLFAGFLVNYRGGLSK